MSKVINDVSFKLETNVNELPSHTAADEGKVLTVGEHNELEWAEGGTGGVTSVNGQTGVVVLESSDIGDDSSVGGDTIALSLNALKSAIDDIDEEKQDVLTAGSNITISGSTISATDTTYTAGTGINISAGNVISSTVTAPVTSVNTKTGDVVINATDVKLTTTQTTVQANIQRIDEELNRIEGEIPTKVSDLTNDEGFSVVSGTNDGTNWTSITIDGTTKAIPSGGGDVESVNGQTGVVVLDAGDLMFDDENTVEQAITDNTNYIEAVADDVVDNTTAINALQSSKQDTLTAGTNITIENNVISATGGGGGTEYTFTNGLTETDGTVSLGGTMPAGGIELSQSSRLLGYTDLLGWRINLYHGTGAGRGLLEIGAGIDNDTGFMYYESTGSTSQSIQKTTCFSVSQNIKAGTRVYLNFPAVDGEIPAASVPTSDGNYVLKCSIVDGVATYSWVAE